MAEKKPVQPTVKPPLKPDVYEQFDTEVYKLGLELIENFRTGKCHDRDKTLEAIIEIFKRDCN